MKSIKEKAEEFHKVIRVINEHESIVNTQGSKMFVEGANYVLDAITECLPKTYSFNPNEAIDIIVSRIKELKGKLPK
jgi:hypothetical protein